MSPAEKTAVWLDKLNFRIPGGRWQLFEFSDLWMYVLDLRMLRRDIIANLSRNDRVPPFIKHDAQDALARLYTRTLPFLQRNSPAVRFFSSSSGRQKDRHLLIFPH